MNTHVEFSALKGQTLVKITGGVGDERMEFITTDGERFTLFHDQD